MNCSEARHFVYAHADGETVFAGGPAVASHFATCHDCGRFVEEQRGLRAAVCRGIEQVAVPTGLEERIRKAIEADRSRRRVFGISVFLGFKPLAVAACIAIGVGAITWRYAFSGKPAHPVAIAIATKHQFCIDRGSDHHHVGLPTTLAGLVGAINAHEDYRFDTIAPDLSAYGFRFESANFCGLKDRKCRNGGHVIYVRRDGDKSRRFSVFSVPQAAPLDALENLANRKGRLESVTASPDDGGPAVCMVLWHKNQTHYVCCGDVEPDELVKMATTVQMALANTATEEMFMALASGR